MFSNENIYSENTLLFSLYKDIEPLDINEFHKTNYIELNNFLQNHDIIKIEPWLKSATEKDFDGDITLVVFPLLRVSKKGPEQTAEEIGNYLHKINILALIDRNNLIFESIISLIVIF